METSLTHKKPTGQSHAFRALKKEEDTFIRPQPPLRAATWWENTLLLLRRRVENYAVGEHWHTGFVATGGNAGAGCAAVCNCLAARQGRHPATRGREHVAFASSAAGTPVQEGQMGHTAWPYWMRWQSARRRVLVLCISETSGYGFGSCLRSGGGKFWPVFVPIIWAHLLACNKPIAHALNSFAVLRRNSLLAIQHLRDERRRNANRARQSNCPAALHADPLF